MVVVATLTTTITANPPSNGRRIGRIRRRGLDDFGAHRRSEDGIRTQGILRFGTWRRYLHLQKKITSGINSMAVGFEIQNLTSGIRWRALSKLRFLWCWVMFIRVLVTCDTGGNRIPIDLRMEKESMEERQY